MKEKNRKKMNTVAWVCIVVAVFAITMAFFIGGLAGRETVVSTDGSSVSMTSLYCSAEKPEKAFFTSDVALSEKQEVRFAFGNSGISKVAYTYTGKFASKDAADNALSKMHADYNTYMGKIDMYSDDLTPNFTLLDSEAAISLYIERDHFMSGTAEFAFLSTSEFIKARNYSAEELKNLYENKKFTCKISE